MNWLIQFQMSTPLTEHQRHDYDICLTKLYSLLNLPLAIRCIPSETLWNGTIEQATLPIANRNPLKMYWQRNLHELRLFLKENVNRTLEANLIEIHKRRRVQLTRFVKQDMCVPSVTLSFSAANPTSNAHVLLLTVTAKQCVFELQIPSLANPYDEGQQQQQQSINTLPGVIYRGIYRKMAEDAQLRPVTALFNCTIHIDLDMALLLNEYGLCRIPSIE